MVLFLCACGGGGGDVVNRPVSTDNTSTDLPSPQAPASTLSGTVAMGAPVVGATVTAKCLSGTVQALAPTDVLGAYTVAMQGATPPCLLQALGGAVSGSPNSEVLHGAALAVGLAHVNPLTELALAQGLGQAPSSVYASNDHSAALNSALLTRAQQYVKAQLVSMGLAAPSEDLFSGAFAIGDTTDQALDELSAAMMTHYATISQLRQAAINGTALTDSLAQARATELARLAAEAAAQTAAEAIAAAADTVSGTVAVDGRISGANIILRCRAGSPQSGIRTDSEGRFAVRLYQATLPCMVEARGGTAGGQSSSAVLHGWAASAGGEVQVTSLSELALAYALSDSPVNVFPRFAALVTPPSSTELIAAQNWLDTQLQSLGLGSGVGDVFSGLLTAGGATETKLLALAQRLYDKDSSLAAILPTAQAQGSLIAKVDADRQIAIQFAAVAAGTPIQCGDLLRALGSTSVSAKLADFRFYIQDAALLRADDVAVPIRLLANSDWQYTASNGDAVTLIDLENGSAECGTEGNAAMNALLPGTVPAGRYTGLLFTVGVPESLSHTSTATAPAPLDSLAMAWGWQAGRKFLKIEVTQPVLNAWSSDTFYVHQGSIGCTGNAGQGTVVCSKPNRAVVRLTGFQSGTHKVNVDVSALLEGTNITVNQGGAGGCMSAATDLDCLKVFEVLGIAWRSDGTGTGLPVNNGLSQTVFKAVAK